MAGHSAELTIREIGARGDGVALLEDGTRVFIPFTLPGERVLARFRTERAGGVSAEPRRILKASQDRARPRCRHFGTCGACALQHASDDAYRRLKRELLNAALSRQGIEAAPIAPLTAGSPGARRRADLTAVRRGSDLLLGFNERGSHRVFQLEECPVLRPAIVALVEPLRAVLAGLMAPGARAEAILNETETGIDLLLVTGAPLKRAAQERLAAFAGEAGLARISRRRPGEGGGETLAEFRKPLVTLAGTALAPPPGAFMQATAEGEKRLSGFVAAACEGLRKAADLYAGIGTFTFALADGGAAVHAVEGDRHALDALQAAARSAGLDRIGCDRRDLAKRPLRADELNRFDAVVFDPPRAGAKEQARELAASSVPIAVAVSCNPATFARDARILIDGGFELESVQPVDQFLWSPHLELAALFRRRR